MAKYVVKRVIMALVTILVVACVTFLLMMSVPGSPFNDEKITEQQRAQMDAKYGLDKPLVIQMANYMKGALKGDLGVSLKMQKDRPVLEIITTFLGIYGMLLVRKRTGNAWGCVFAFCCIWNAF